MKLTEVEMLCNCRTDELKFGDLVGVDEHGNKYYQNKMYFVGNYLLHLVFTARCYASAVLAVIVSVCLSVRPSVCLSVCHKSELYKDG